MSVRTPFAAAVLLGAGLVLGTTATGAAAATAPVCDAYSGTCTTPPAVSPTETTTTPVGDGGTGGGSTGGGSGVDASDSGDLPFTGGDVVLVSVLGAAALAGGTVLVLAGRRKSTPAV